MSAEYSAQEHAEAWASYYAQQGYTTEQVLAVTGYDPNTGKFYGTPTPTASGSGHGSADPAMAGGYDQTAAVYDPTAAGVVAGTLGADGIPVAPKSKKAVSGKRDTVIRKGGGKVWEDTTLVDWDPKWYRLFVGDVSNDVNERTLDNAFNAYPTYCKSKVIRDRLSLKAKYAFIAFKDPEDFLRAWKEMDGKYVGQRPIRLMKVKDDKYGGIATTNVSARKAKQLDKLKKNKGKPLDGRPTPY